MSIVSTNSGGQSNQYGKMSRERGAKGQLQGPAKNNIAGVYSSGKRSMGGLSAVRQGGPMIGRKASDEKF